LFQALSEFGAEGLDEIGPVATKKPKRPSTNINGDQMVGLVAFVARCTAAATIAYLSARAVGLPHPLWTCIFALVGSQDSEKTIFTTIGGRVGGTVIGVIVAIAVGAVTHRLKLDLVWQIAIAVAICAVFAWGRPAIQLCMWTAPIIFLSASPAESIASVGFYRGCEVILGILIGGLFLVSADRSRAWVDRTRHQHHKN
jgi:uncharacterized membrane protein YgaE (UPF0421/DUF939 family)